MDTAAFLIRAHLPKTAGHHKVGPFLIWQAELASASERLGEARTSGEAAQEASQVRLAALDAALDARAGELAGLQAALREKEAALTQQREQEAQVRP